jgi:3-keto-L-gulonate-6-phosphate decarboxylase
MMEQVDLLDLAKQIVRLQKDIYSELSITGGIDPDKARLLTGCKDYCTYLILSWIRWKMEVKM